MHLHIYFRKPLPNYLFICLQFIRSGNVYALPLFTACITYAGTWIIYLYSLSLINCLFRFEIVKHCMHWNIFTGTIMSVAISRYSTIVDTKSIFCLQNYCIFTSSVFVSTVVYPSLFVSPELFYCFSWINIYIYIYV